ncbi:MAG: hypothetical protein Aurels2KO_40960 [Aureliella sp.]
MDREPRSGNSVLALQSQPLPSVFNSHTLDRSAGHCRLKVIDGHREFLANVLRYTRARERDTNHAPFINNTQLHNEIFDSQFAFQSLQMGLAQLCRLAGKQA